MATHRLEWWQGRRFATKDVMSMMSASLLLLWDEQEWQAGIAAPEWTYLLASGRYLRHGEHWPDQVVLHPL